MTNQAAFYLYEGESGLVVRWLLPYLAYYPLVITLLAVRMFWIKCTLLVSLLMMSPVLVSGQAEQSSPSRAQESSVGCVSPLAIKSPALLRELKRFLTPITANELPILALETRGDSLFCYVSALMSTHSIARNPPTAILRVLNREVLLYTGHEAAAQLSTSCHQYLLSKYVALLHVDKVNQQQGLLPGTDEGWAYDPVNVKISLRGGQVVSVTNPAQFPYFTR